MKSELFPALNDITFAEKSGEEIEAEVISTYESITERTLAKGDPIRLFLEAIVLIIVHNEVYLIMRPSRIYWLMLKAIILTI